MPNDIYGRSVVFSTDGTIDTYTVDGGAIVICYPAGTDQGAIYNSINAMAPG